MGNGKSNFQQDQRGKTVRQIQTEAKNGDPVAQLHLGNIYYEGSHNFAQDYSEAVKWYNLSANERNTDAQYKLGQCYAFGHGVPQDWNKAFRWYHLSATRGHADAQYEIGEYYFNGLRDDEDNSAAIKWYQKSADQGNERAQFILGKCYEIGYGVPQNYIEAMKWYTYAATKGDKDAQVCLGKCYEYGKGVQKDLNEAVKWYAKAANMKDLQKQGIGSIWQLGDCYFLGIGVNRDQKQAIKYYRKALESQQEVSSWNVMDFEMQELLGTGSWGEVYQGVGRLNGMLSPLSKVAIKKIEYRSKDCNNNTNSESSRIMPMERALLENHIMGLAPEHPNIVKRYTSCFKNDEAFIIMELADFTLEELLSANYTSNKRPTAYLQEHKVDINHYRVNLAYQVACGMMALHSRHIMHADLKSNNVLIRIENDQLVAKIGDFGLSCLTVMLDTDLLPEKYLTANIHISSPERLEIVDEESGKQLKVVHMCKACDVYSFGMLMYRMLQPVSIAMASSHYLTLPTNQLEFYQSIQKGSRPDLPSIDPSNTAMVTYISLLQQCWGTEPEQRPTFEEIVYIIEESMRTPDGKFDEFNYNPISDAWKMKSDSRSSSSGSNNT